MRRRAAPRKRADIKRGASRPPRSCAPLTTRHLEIVRLICKGLTNREIAADLDLSVRTVEVHRFNLMRRLNVRNVAQLLRAVLQQGLLGKRGLASLGS